MSLRKAAKMTGIASTHRRADHLPAHREPILDQTRCRVGRLQHIHLRIRIRRVQPVPREHNTDNTADAARRLELHVQLAQQAQVPRAVQAYAAVGQACRDHVHVQALGLVGEAQRLDGGGVVGGGAGDELAVACVEGELVGAVEEEGEVVGGVGEGEFVDGLAGRVDGVEEGEGVGVPEDEEAVLAGGGHGGVGEADVDVGDLVGVAVEVGVEVAGEEGGFVKAEVVDGE